MKLNLHLKDTFESVNALVGKEMAVYCENHMQSKHIVREKMYTFNNEAGNTHLPVFLNN
jgi:hypothetical protein